MKTEIDQFAARCYFPAPGQPFRCGVSGGADSLAMMILAVHVGCDVTAIYVDHGLRADSKKDGEFVAAMAKKFGAQFSSVKVEVGEGGNIEARARAARHEALGDAAIAHTADDLAETMIINLLRGAGPQGLSGPQLSFRHPVLQLRRADTERVCALHEVEWINDPMNSDQRFVRNRIRHEVLPLLSDIAQRDVVAVLTRQSPLFAEQSEFINALADQLDPTDANALAAAPPVVAKAAIRQWLRATEVENHPPDQATVERVMAVVNNQATGTDIGGGRRVERTNRKLRIEVGNTAP